MAIFIGSNIVQFKFETLTTIESNWTIRIITLSERFNSQSTCDFCNYIL
jgi:hypothetical protein